VSISYCFICLLHLANEKNLAILGDGQQRDDEVGPSLNPYTTPSTQPHTTHSTQPRDAEEDVCGETCAVAPDHACSRGRLVSYSRLFGLIFRPGPWISV
jgi:hypothetical protein